jgi:hypothetical protein
MFKYAHDHKSGFKTSDDALEVYKTAFIDISASSSTQGVKIAAIYQNLRSNNSIPIIEG